MQLIVFKCSNAEVNIELFSTKRVSVFNCLYDNQKLREYNHDILILVKPASLLTVSYCIHMCGAYMFHSLVLKTKFPTSFPFAC